jgi:UDP-N-acetylmuramate dehydrogenase
MRHKKQPWDQPSAGSVFKRPKGNYAGPLITAAGLKGYRVGGAQVSTKHAGFIVNRGTATAADIIKLIRLIQKRVYKHSGVKLELEQIILK